MQPREICALLRRASSISSGGPGKSRSAGPGASTPSTRCPTRAGSPTAPAAPLTPADDDCAARTTTTGPGAGHVGGQPQGQRRVAGLHHHRHPRPALFRQVRSARRARARHRRRSGRHAPVPRARLLTCRRPTSPRCAARISRSRPDATVRTRTGGPRPMHQVGHRRAAAPGASQCRRHLPRHRRTEALAGRPLDGFLYEGPAPTIRTTSCRTRTGASCAGLRVFSAWVNHTDAKAINSLDTLVTENGRTYVRHHLHRLQRHARQRRHRPARAPRRLRVPRRDRARQEGAAGLRLLCPAVDDDRLSRRTAASAGSSRTRSCPSRGARACRTRPTSDRGRTIPSGRRAS